MSEVICNTSPLQYLHQLGRLELLPLLAGRVVVPPAVIDELAVGKANGVAVPEPLTLDWITVRQPNSIAVLPLAVDLGSGEAAVLALALETPDAVVIIDDALARRRAELLGIRLTGTLGILLDAKRAGLVDAVAPLLDGLQQLRFRLSSSTRADVLKLAGEIAG